MDTENRKPGLLQRVRARLGRAVQRALRVTGLATRLARGAQKVVRTPLDWVQKPIQTHLDAAIDRLPHRLGGLLQPLADRFLASGVNWLAPGPLGALLHTLGLVAGVGDRVDRVLSRVDGALGGGVAGLPPEARHNAQEAFAHAQARELWAA